jgi:putative ABC transport system permease protein
MGIRIITGRAFTDHDNAAAIISESLARHLWPNGEAVGKQISMDDRWLTIVGIAADVRQTGLTDKASAIIYQPYLQINQPGFLDHMSFVVQTSTPAAAAASLRAIIRRLDADLPVQSITTMDSIVAASINDTRSQTRLLTIFSILALLLAAIGIYGVLAFSVAQRTHEIGIRMALGAETPDILWMVLGRTLALVATGLLIGLPAALALTRVLTKLLFEVTPADPLTYSAVIAILITVALLAACIPARRATRVHPATALHYD